MRAGPGPGGRPQKDVRKPLARHAAHGAEEPAEPPQGVLGAPPAPQQPATFAPQGRGPAQGYDPYAPAQPADPYAAPAQPAGYDPYAAARPAGYEPYAPQAYDPYAGAGQAGPSAPSAPSEQGLPPVPAVPPGPMTTALPTALNYGHVPLAPAAPAPAAPSVPSPSAPSLQGPSAPPLPVRPSPAPGPEQVRPQAPYAPYDAPRHDERHEQRYDERSDDRYDERYDGPSDDGYRIRSAAADTDSTVLPSRRSRRDNASHRTGPPVKGSAPASALGAVVEVAVVVALALVLAVVVKSFFVQAFSIPSGSMEDTLLVGDRVLVSKLTPGVFDLHRGDVVVFADSGHWLEPTAPTAENPVKHALRSALTAVGLLPDPSDEHLIKRVIGLPGDTVVCCDAQGRLTVNGAPIDEPYLRPGVTPSEKRFSVVVPEGRLWVMGDNRSFSADSRSHMNLPGGGTVPESDVVGKAFAVVWPFGRFGGLGIPDSVFAGVPPASGGT